MDGDISNEVRVNPPMKWYQIWWYVWSHPGVEAFRTILNDPKASSSRGFIWVAVASLLSALTSSLLNTLFGFRDPELAFLAFLVVCTVILAPLFAVISLAILAGIYRFFAGLFGGTGTWDKLVFCIAAISAPASLFSIPATLLTLVSRRFDSNGIQVIPGCIIPLLGLALGIYAIVLYVSAISSVEGISQGKALVIYLIPVIILIALVICLIAVGVLPVIWEATRQLQ